MKQLALVALVAVFTTCGFAEGMRTWKSRKGSTIQAELIEDNGEDAILRTGDGRKMAIRRVMLSPEDIAYLDHLRQQAQEEKRRELEELRRAMFKPSGISVKEFHATRPTEPVVFLAKAQLSDYFNYEFNDSLNPGVRGVYWSVSLHAPRGESIGNGYILKEGRGAKLFALIKDGKWHRVIVRVRYMEASRDSGVFLLDDYQRVQDKDDTEDAQK